MQFVLVTVDTVIKLHDEVINIGELTGLAKDKSLEGALARVEHRLNYGLVNNVYDLAASYAMAIATGHCYNDANKRTALFVMLHVLSLNQINHDFDNVEIAKKIIAIAQGELDEVSLAEWLREKTKDKQVDK